MDLLFRNVQLVDGTGRAPLRSANVAVKRGVITWIGEGKVDMTKHSHYEEIAGDDMTLLPGLFDCHEHFTGDGGPNGVAAMNVEPAETLLNKGAANARRALLAGHTSARDVGSPFGVGVTLAKAVAAGNMPGPRISAAGQWLQFPTTWTYPMTRMVETSEAMKAAVLEQIAQGAAIIKVGATGTREDGTDYATLGLDVATMVVELAHGAGLKAAAHCTGYKGTRQVVEAGIDSVEHGTFIDEPTAKLMGERGTYVVPTMSTWDYRLRHAKQAKLTKEEIERTEGRRDASRASFKRCMLHKVRIAAGTDAGGSAVRHGTIVRELELMVEAGMTPMQAIVSATRTAAELFGSLDHVGTIELGKTADLILVDGDPTEEISELRKIWAIYQGGRRIR